ncbi:MAG: nucleotidyltransferase domain-containing protein [Bacteroidales bacterium]|nr:nucleotidyltransferase domain-containing protein [Bacteroidales bacterium]
MSGDVIQTIREYFATQPIEKAWLFGSYARGEERADSDVDILVTLDKEAKVGLLQYVHIMNELKSRLNKEVDMVVDGTLLPFAVESANRDKKLIYERTNKR